MAVIGQPGFYASYLRNITFLLVLVLILAYVLVKLKGRDGGKFPLPRLPFLINPIAAAEDSRIEVIERKALEARKMLYLVRIFDNQYWLIATTDTSIEALGEVRAPEYLHATEATKPFSDYLDKS